MIPRSARIWSSRPQMKERLSNSLASEQSTITDAVSSISRPTLHLNLPKPIAMSRQIDTYTQLRQQIHDDLRIQHPEWVESDGGSPRCDSYDERLMELLDRLTRRGSNESVAAIHLALGHGTGS